MAKDDNPFLSQEWQDMQRQYVEALSAFYPKQKTTDTLYTNPQAWNDALEFWWKSVQSGSSDNNKPVMDAILNQSKIFYSITDQFASMFKEIGNAGKDTNDWEGIVHRNLEQMKAMFDQYSNQNSYAASAPSFMWTQPIESWKQVMSGITVLPDDMLEKIMQQGSREFSDKLLSMPGIGMTGEIQEKLQTTIRLWNEYQANSNRYRDKFTELGKQAVDKLRDNIFEKANNNEKISSLKEIYNMWIDANEEVFATYISNEDYSELYGELVNSLVEFKKHSNELSDEMLRSMNIPTSEGINTVTRRQHQIKNQLRSTMEMQQKTMDTLEQIQKELQKIQTQMSGKKQPKTKKKSTTAKKKRISKTKKKSKKS